MVLPAYVDKLLDENDLVLQVGQLPFLLSRGAVLRFGQTLKRLHQSIQSLFIVLVIIYLHLI